MFRTTNKLYELCKWKMKDKDFLWIGMIAGILSIPIIYFFNYYLYGFKIIESLALGFGAGIFAELFCYILYNYTSEDEDENEDY